jgi:hypothetical protein
LLVSRDLSPAPVPADTDYSARLEAMGIGLSHSKLRAGRPLDEVDIIAYLAHSRVTEQRASEQMRSLRRYSTGHADVRRAVTPGARAQACNLVMDPAGDEVLPAVGWVGCLARRETGWARQ